jgi:hypothetical protein
VFILAAVCEKIEEIETIKRKECGSKTLYQGATRVNFIHYFEYCIKIPET